MNLAELQRKLLAAGRARPPAAAVPYAFEQRIMARLRGAPVSDAWADWARALWRAAAPCLAVALLLGVWTVAAPARPEPAPADFAQAFEATVFAAITLEGDPTW